IGGASNSAENISGFNMLTNDNDTENAWQNSYNGIFICNDVIQRLESTDVEFSTDQVKNRLKAEASFVRALIYFNMVRVWGDVPLPLKPLSPEESYEYLREGEDIVYRQIIDDLEFAKDNLPNTYSGNNIGRITKYAASAVLAKVYLTNQNQEKAKVELEEVINSG